MIDIDIDVAVRRTARTDVVAVGIGPDGRLLDGTPDRALPEPVRALVETFAAESGPAPNAGEVRTLPLPGQRPRRVLLAGIGAGAPAEARLAGAGIARATDARRVAVAVPGLSDAAVTALVEGLILGAYRIRPGSADDDLAGVDLIAPSGDGIRAAVDRGRDRAAATVWARDLANTRASTKTPVWLAQQAAAQLTPLGVRVEVRDERWLSGQGFGGVLAVGAGSASPPRLIEASWRPDRRRSSPRHLVLVGKGITFDSGGLNLKPVDNMRLMYTDMAGGAAALAAVRTVATRRWPVQVTVLVPTAENSVSGSAMRPGDVVRHYGGRTTEVQNTDAEGRLVLADALAYAVARLRPTALVDLATLTGAMKVALGVRTGGLFSTDDNLAAALLAAGADAGEPLWRMPFVEEHVSLLDSTVADAQNAPGNPGGITAALFLRPFSGDVPWAHLDLAGPARATADAGPLSQGATGFGARLLVRWIEQQADG
jgi:leucyl aminopeptidase